MIISDLNHLETVEKTDIVGGLVAIEVYINKKATYVNQFAAAEAKNESVGGGYYYPYYYGGGASANASNSAYVY